MFLGNLQCLQGDRTDQPVHRTLVIAERRKQTLDRHGLVAKGRSCDWYGDKPRRFNLGVEGCHCAVLIDCILHRRKFIADEFCYKLSAMCAGAYRQFLVRATGSDEKPFGSRDQIAGHTQAVPR